MTSPVSVAGPPRLAGFVPYQTLEFAGSFVVHLIVAPAFVIPSARTFEIEGADASTVAVATASWAGFVSEYTASIDPPSLTWRIPSAAGSPKAVLICPRHTPEPGAVSGRVTGSGVPSTVLRTFAMTGAPAFASWTSMRIVSLSLYTFLSRRMSPYPRSRSATATTAKP